MNQRYAMVTLINQCKENITHEKLEEAVRDWCNIGVDLDDSLPASITGPGAHSGNPGSKVRLNPLSVTVLHPLAVAARKLMRDKTLSSVERDVAGQLHAAICTVIDELAE